LTPWGAGQHPCGVSLTDLLVALAVLGLLLAGTLALLDEGQRTWAQGAARVEAQQSARVALARLARELRQAGYGGTAGAFDAISVAERSRLVMHLDLDGDGRTTGRGETVTWRLAGRVLRRSAGGGAQPVAEGVHDLELTYFDAAGRPTRVPSEVRTVGIRITTGPADTAAGAGVTMSTRVRLRNR
jgi:type II secretory pathway component PulJ